MHRDIKFDALRSIAMLMVILLHSTSMYIEKGLNENFVSVEFWYANLINSLSRVCVPTFIMISGRFLLGRDEGFFLSYKKRATKLIPPLVIWTIVYLVYAHYSDNVPIKSLILKIIYGKPYYHMWYLYMLVGLYLFVPFITCIFQKLKHHQKILTGMIFLLLGIILNVFNYYVGTKQFFLLWFFQYLGYFILGYTMPNSKILETNILFILYLASSVLTVILFLAFKRTFGNYFYGYLSPIVILSSITFYKSFILTRRKFKFLASFAKYSLGIYLVHALIMDILKNIIMKYEIIVLQNAFWGIPFLFISVSIISYLTIISLNKVKLMKEIIG